MKITALIFLILTFNVSAQNCDDIPAINAEIVALTRAKVKKKVGSGECWDLAQYVLDETNAKWGGYEYGTLIKHEKECVYPGDIIQFEKIKLKWMEESTTFNESMMHHTAVIVQVINKDEVIIAHQNTADHGKKVGYSIFKFDRIMSGKLFVYRPVRKN